MGTGKRLVAQVNNCGICANELKDYSHLGQEVGAAHAAEAEARGEAVAVLAAAQGEVVAARSADASVAALLVGEVDDTHHSLARGRILATLQEQ